MEPIEFARDLSFIKVDTEAGLIVTPSGLYSVEGKQLLEFTASDASISTIGNNFLIVMKCENSCAPLKAVLWNRKSVLLEMNCYQYKCSNEYFALCTDLFWIVFSSIGENVKLKHISSSEEISLEGEFLITKNSEQSYSVYHLGSEKNILSSCDPKEFILGRKSFFAAKMDKSSHKLTICSGGKYFRFKNVDDCQIIDEKHQLFYIVRNNKFFIYTFDCQRCLEEFAGGVDFVCFNKESNTLMVMDEGVKSYTANFFSPY